MWVPPSVLEEVQIIKRDEDLTANTEAMRKLVKYARIGREASKNQMFPFPTKKKGKGGLFGL